MYWISSRGQPTRRGPPAWRVGDVLTNPYRINVSCYEIFTQNASALDWYFVQDRDRCPVFLLGKKIKKVTASKCSKKKRTEISYEESLLQILRQKKMDDRDVDEEKCFLLSLLPSFRQFIDEQKLFARMKILKVMRHFKLQQYLDTHSSCSLPSFSNANIFHRNSSHFASSPLNPQPITSMQNSEILSRFFSSYSVDPQRLPTSTTVLPQYHNSLCPALSPVTHLPATWRME